MMKKIPNLKKKVDLVKFPLFFNGLFFGLPGIIYPRNSHFKIHGFLSSILMPQKRSVKFTNQQKNYESRSVSKNDPPVKLSYMDVSKNRGKLPKWMVKIMETPIKMDDLGIPLFSETTISTSIMRPFSEVSIISFFPFGSRYVGQPFPGKGQFFFCYRGYGKPRFTHSRKPDSCWARWCSNISSINWSTFGFPSNGRNPGGQLFSRNSWRSAAVESIWKGRRTAGRPGESLVLWVRGIWARVFRKLVVGGLNSHGAKNQKNMLKNNTLAVGLPKIKSAEIRETNSSPLKIGPRAPKKGQRICCFKECVTLPIHGEVKSPMQNPPLSF